ncbi:MAG: zinc-ribbon domain-containing protein [Lachnospiraceae bacterium]|nr:zinc-ribbon domain-containing protein [Lachnospiraceae bacterium]
MKCSNCNSELAPGAKFCTKCGTAAPADTGNQCSKCGAQLVPGAKFCTKCGTPAPESKPEEVKNECAKCGAELAPGAKFCTKCGTAALATKIDSEPQPTPIEEKSVEEIVIEEKPAEEAVVEEPVVEETVVEEKPAEEAVVEEPVVEEAAVEENPIEETVVEENAVEEVVAEEKSVEIQPAQKICGKCNAVLVSRAKFCGKCGTPYGVIIGETPMVTAEEPVAEEIPVVPKTSVAEEAIEVTKSPAVEKTPVVVKEKKGNGNAGWIVAIVIISILLITVLGVGIYILFIKPDKTDSLVEKEEMVQVMEEEPMVEEPVVEEPVVEEPVVEEPVVEEPVVEEPVLKDYENPEYMNGPTSLGRSDRVSVLDFIAPIPDDSIEQPADGSIPVQYFDPSIHEYQLFIEDVTFYEASQRCEEMGGHLATIVCKEELVMVQDLLRKSGYHQREVPYIIWLGAYIDQSTGMYAWCTGEGIGVSNWKPGEPTSVDPDTGEKEEYIMMAYDVATDQWVWLDESYDITTQYSGNIAYLCEWEVITDPNYYEDLKTR